MAKIQIKSEKLTPFGGIFSIMEKFEHTISPVIDQALGLRCSSYGYQYSEIIRSLMTVYFCGGNCIEDISNHLLSHLSLHPLLRTCSSDTILRAINELTTDNITYKSVTGKSYDFNAAEKVNSLLLDTLLSTRQLDTCTGYDLDFDHEFLETEKYDAKRTYKRFLGYTQHSTMTSLLYEAGRLLRLVVLNMNLTPLSLKNGKVWLAGLSFSVKSG